MKTIYKEKLNSETVLELPIGYKILDIQPQTFYPVMWILGDFTLEKKKVRISAYVTGQALPDNHGEYLATIQEGNYVYHFFLTEE